MTILSLLILIINGHQCDSMVYEPTINVKPQVVVVRPAAVVIVHLKA